MTRPLNFTVQNLQFLSKPTSSFFVLIAVFSVFSFVTYLCTSHRAKKSIGETEETCSRSSEKRLLTKLNSSISSKTHMMVKMILWQKVQAEEEEEEDDSDDAFWRKEIIMGERCRPLDFSEKILYDSEGNLLPVSDLLDQNMNQINNSLI